jgi:Tfp pilus assembly protein PilN
MIDINLVPPHLRKKKKSSLRATFNMPKETIVGLIGGLLVLLLLVHVILQAFIFIKYAQHKNYQTRWESISPDKEKVDVIINELRSLQAKTKAVYEISYDKRISWAPKLNALSDNIPREVWLTRIFLEDNALLIQGSAVSKVRNEMISVGNFVSNLKEQKNFQEDLATVELGSIQRRNIKAVEVVDFVITAKLAE